MLPIIVAGSRPAVAGLAQRRHFDCNTSVDLLRLLHARITETPRSRVSFASTVLLNPIGSLRPSHAQKPNRHRAPRHRLTYPFPRFPPLEVFERRPQAAEFAAPTVTDRHPKTFTIGDITRKIRDCPGGGVGLSIQRPMTLRTQNCACNRPEKIETGPRSALYPGLSMN
jgi:hypothetical protein